MEPIFASLLSVEKTCKEKPCVFIEVGITRLPQLWLLGKPGGCCYSHSVDVNKQAFIPPARSGVRVMTECPASL